jgi:hypothetical protein
VIGRYLGEIEELKVLVSVTILSLIADELTFALTVSGDAAISMLV